MLGGLGGGGMPGGGLGSGLSAPLGALSGLGRLGQFGGDSDGQWAGLDGQRPGGGSQRGESAVDAARTKLGSPYVWGASGPRAFDCSGLVQWAYRQQGVNLPRTTYALMHAGQAVSPNDIRPGDLILSNWSGPGTPEHVQLAVSPTMVIEAPTPGGHVQMSHIPSGRIAVRRVV